MVDSLKVYELLKAHFPDLQARSMTHAIQQAETDIEKDVKSVVEAAFAQCPTKADLANAKSEMIRWMFVFWVGQVAVTVGLFTLLK
jgi:hypothetical protein